MIGNFKPVIKFQTALGGVQYILFASWLSSIFATLQHYHNNDRHNFNCNPKPSDFIRQLCYNNYISAITKPHGLIPRDVVGITFLIVCGVYIIFTIYGAVTLRKRPGDRNKNTNTFLCGYFIQVGFRILFLGFMSGLVYSYKKIVLPEVFKCDVNQTNSQTTPSPLNQTKITLICHDLHHEEKSKINIAFIAVNVFFMALSIFEVLHLWRNRETCLQHLIRDLEDFKADDSLQSLPEKPTITNTEMEVDKDFIVTWSEAEANNSNCSIEYRLEWRKQPVTGSTKMVQRANTEGNHFMITGLEYDAEYEVKLFTVNKQGDSEPDVRTFKTKSGLPEKPTITNTEMEVDKDFIVTWSEAEANNSNCSIEYRLEWRKQPVTGSTEMVQRNIVGTRFTITNLEYDAEYEVKLFTVNKQGDSEPDVRTFKTKSGTVITPRENRPSAQKSNASPPELNIALKSIIDLPKTCLNRRDVELPVDILLLTVEDCEFLSCFAYLKKPFRSYFTRIGFVYFDQRKNMKIALMRCHEGLNNPGSPPSSLSKEVISKLNPGAIFSVGACSGFKNVKLGDVVVSIIPLYKTPPSRDIGNLIQHVADGWKAPVKNANECNAKVHCDGVVLSISGTNRDIIEQYPEVIAVEKEDGGMFAAAYDAKIEWVVVKGIKDLTGEKQSSSEEWKKFASVMAASVVANILNDPVIFQHWRRSDRSTAS